MDLNQLLDPAHLKSDFVAIAIVVFALLLILLFNRHRLLTRFREWQIQRCLDRIGSDQIRNLTCADGLDGHYRIDRLALVGDAILLVSYKPYGGNIYCAENISEWTQVVGQKSYKFENPLFELENQLTALRQLVGKAELRGYLFFNQSAVFPKGHPASVLQPGTTPETYLAENCATPSAEIRAAWSQLQNASRQSPQQNRVGAKT